MMIILGPDLSLIQVSRRKTLNSIDISKSLQTTGLLSFYYMVIGYVSR
jgi:hypothetical protein